MMEKRRRRWRKPLIFLAAFILAVPVLALVCAEVFLQSKSFTELVNKSISPYVDGEAQIDRLDLSLLRSFPNARAEIEGLDIIYPHERFAQYDQNGIRSELLESGRGEVSDTLVSAKRLHVSLNCLQLLRGRFVIPRIEAEGIRAHIHVYDSTASNLDILKLPQTTEEDSSDTKALPYIMLRKASLTDRCQFTYTSLADTLLSRISLSEMKVRGHRGYRGQRRDIEDRGQRGRREHREHRGRIGLKADADALIYMPFCGRLALPIGIDGEIDYPQIGKDSTHIRLHGLRGHIASLPVEMTGTVSFHPDSTYWDFRLIADEAPYQKVIEESGEILPQLLHDIKTDAKVDIEVVSRGHSLPGEIMPLKVHMKVPESKISYLDLVRNGDFDLEFDATVSPQVDIDVDIRDMGLKMKGLDATLKGALHGVTSDDMEIELENSRVSADLGSLNHLIPSDLGANASGSIDLGLAGRLRMSQLSSLNLSDAELSGRLEANGLNISLPSDTLEAHVSHADIRIATMNSINSKRDKALGLSAGIDSVRVQMGTGLIASLKDVAAVVQSDEKAISGSNLHPLIGSLTASRVFAKSGEDMMAGLRNTKNSFRIVPANRLPHITVTTENDGIFVRSGLHRAIVGDVRVSLEAQKRGESLLAERNRRGARWKAHMDSLRHVYPDVPRDSLMRMAFASIPRRELPKYLQEREFASKDIDIRLTGSLADYFSEWEPKGNIRIGRGKILTPALPLRNSLSDFSGEFSENEIDIHSLSLRAGQSDLRATGSLKGLRRALSSRGMLELDLELGSDYLNANELLAAVSAGAESTVDEEDLELDDDQFETMVVIDTLHQAEGGLNYSLIVIPANVHVKAALKTGKVVYSDIGINSMSLSATMKERCLQFTDGTVETDFGTVLANAFYSTQTKEDISAGFDLRLNDVTAERIIELIPQTDSLVPELKSFKGLMDCQIAATSQLDTNMNVSIPTLSGIVKIGGRNLSIEQTGALKKISKLLMFANKDENIISDMSIYGTIKDNRLEVFPFVLEVDRYAIALRGVQEFDRKFDYNVSLVKSPLPFKLGVDVYGSDFDHIRYRLGRSRYKSSEVAVFSSQVDTMQLNLVRSIRDIFSKGVAAAIRENEESHSRMEQRKQALGYDAEGTETLSLKERLDIDQSVIEMDMLKDDEELQAEIDAVMEQTMMSLETVGSELVKKTSAAGKRKRSALLKESLN